MNIAAKTPAGAGAQKINGPRVNLPGPADAKFGLDKAAFN